MSLCLSEVGPGILSILAEPSEAGRRAQRDRYRSSGWQRALAQYAQVDNKQAFYRAFDAFLKKPLDEQLKMLEGLKD